MIRFEFRKSLPHLLHPRDVFLEKHRAARMVERGPHRAVVAQPKNEEVARRPPREHAAGDGDLGERLLGGHVRGRVVDNGGRQKRTSLQKYSPLDWSGYFHKEKDVAIEGSNNVFHIYEAGSEGPVVFCLHGGGYSGLSFALSAKKISEKARVVAMDLRGHGKSSTERDLDLSIETLCNDVVAVLKTIYGDSAPAIILVGHSMGGSVAVHIAARKVIPNLHGLVVVDVVEGTAMASLIHMQKILSNRMQFFPSLEKAIEWSIKGGSLRNLESARISVPSTLKFDESKECYTYRTALEETESYWKGWYEGLSEKFLSCPVPKLLLLAGADRLDRVLTIGQMQGKFQMVVVRHTGHPIQEDVPEEFASLILNFISRNRIGPHGLEIPGILRPSQT